MVKESYKTSASSGVRAKSVPPVQKRVPPFFIAHLCFQEYPPPLPNLIFGWNPISPIQKREGGGGYETKVKSLRSSYREVLK